MAKKTNSNGGVTQNEASKIMVMLKTETLKERLTKEAENNRPPVNHFWKILPFILLLGYALMAIVFICLGV